MTQKNLDTSTPPHSVTGVNNSTHPPAAPHPPNTLSGPPRITSLPNQFSSISHQRESPQPPSPPPPENSSPLSSHKSLPQLSLPSHITHESSLPHSLSHIRRVNSAQNAPTDISPPLPRHNHTSLSFNTANSPLYLSHPSQTLPSPPHPLTSPILTPLTPLSPLLPYSSTIPPPSLFPGASSLPPPEHDILLPSQSEPLTEDISFTHRIQDFTPLREFPYPDDTSVRSTDATEETRAATDDFLLQNTSPRRSVTVHEDTIVSYNLDGLGSSSIGGELFSSQMFVLNRFLVGEERERERDREREREIGRERRTEERRDERRERRDDMISMPPSFSYFNPGYFSQWRRRYGSSSYTEVPPDVPRELWSHGEFDYSDRLLHEMDSLSSSQSASPLLPPMDTLTIATTASATVATTATTHRERRVERGRRVGGEEREGIEGRGEMRRGDWGLYHFELPPLTVYPLMEEQGMDRTSRRRGRGSRHGEQLNFHRHGNRSESESTNNTEAPAYAPTDHVSTPSTTSATQRETVRSVFGQTSTVVDSHVDWLGDWRGEGRRDELRVGEEWREEDGEEERERMETQRRIRQESGRFHGARERRGEEDFGEGREDERGRDAAIDRSISPSTEAPSMYVSLRASGNNPLYSSTIATTPLLLRLPDDRVIANDESHYANDYSYAARRAFRRRRRSQMNLSLRTHTTANTYQESSDSDWSGSTEI